MKAIFLILSIIPKNLVSYLVGVLVRVELPKPLAGPVHRWFIKTFSIDMSEAEYSFDKYSSIEGIFTRKLKPGARNISDAPYVSPSDSVLTCNEAVKNSRSFFTIKGINYNPSELVGENFSNPSWVSVFYLAPHNYHRVHAPIDANIEWIKHIPGNLWPVKPAFLKFLPDLFNKNERLVFKTKPKTGGTAYVVMVGALNVGRMITPFSKTIVTNNSHFAKTKHEVFEKPVSFKRGDEIGTFMMGSTVIVLFDDKALQGLKQEPSNKKNGLPINVGDGLL